MPLSYRMLTGPAKEPVSLLLAKQQCRIDPEYTAEDNLIGIYIAAAREQIEKFCQRAIFEQKWVRTLDHFPLWWSADGTVNPNYRNDWPYYSDYWNRITIDLPMANLVSVTSIKYTDTSGEVQTLDPSTYVVDPTATPGRIVPAQGTYWPSEMTYIPGSVVITYVVGSYGDGVTTNTCPSKLVAAILLFVSHLYNHRDSVDVTGLSELPMGVAALIESETVYSKAYRPI